MEEEEEVEGAPLLINQPLSLFPSLSSLCLMSSSSSMTVSLTLIMFAGMAALGSRPPALCVYRPPHSPPQGSTVIQRELEGPKT